MHVEILIATFSFSHSFVNLNFTTNTTCWQQEHFQRLRKLLQLPWKMTRYWIFPLTATLWKFFWKSLERDDQLICWQTPQWGLLCKLWEHHLTQKVLTKILRCVMKDGDASVIRRDGSRHLRKKIMEGGGGRGGGGGGENRVDAGF